MCFILGRSSLEIWSKNINLKESFAFFVLNANPKLIFAHPVDETLCTNMCTLNSIAPIFSDDIDRVVCPQGNITI